MTTTVKTAPVARLKLEKAICRALKPDVQVRVDEWAEAHRILPDDTPEPGPYRTSRTPYAVDAMRVMSPGSRYSEGWIMGGTQLGKSTVGENCLGTWICAAAGSILVSFPSLDDAKQWEETRFEPLRTGTAQLRKRIPDAHVRSARNTKLRKSYPGGTMRLITANRPPKSSTIRYVKLEEPDEYPMDIEGQGDFIALLRKRMQNFGRRAKMFGDGSPTVKSASVIHREYLRGDQRKWHVPCPECGHAQAFEWKGLRWEANDPDSVAYACSECGVLSPESAWKGPTYRPRGDNRSEQAAAAAGLAHWRATAVGEPGVASWHWPSLIASLGHRPWAGLVREWLDAQKDVEQLKVFVNTVLAEPYEEMAATQISAEALQKRAEPYALWTAPREALLATAAVDTQDNRLAVEVRVWGRGEECWGVFADEIFGDPAQPAVWAKLAELLQQTVKHANGQSLPVEVVTIDAGGHHQEDVLAFTEHWQRLGKHWYAVRGASQYDAMMLGRPKKMKFNYRGAEVPGGATMRYLGTQQIKNRINARLEQVSGPGAFHFPMDYPQDYFVQLRSEKRQWVKDKKGKRVLVWVAGKDRNEYWDLLVYNYAAFLIATQGSQVEAFWKAREKIYGIAEQRDLLNDATDDSATDKMTAAPNTFNNKQAPRRRGGFATRW